MLSELNEQSEGQPFVFVIMPFAAEWQDVYELGIRRACEDAGARCERVDQQIYVENMLERIYAQIEGADLVVAEMTDQNANVLYETGYAHGMGKPVLLLTKTTKDIPFDLRQYPHIVYGNSIVNLKRELQEHIHSLIMNPVDFSSLSFRKKQKAQAETDRMTAHVENYFRAKSFTMAGFERIRDNVNEDYSDAVLRRLIDEFPSRFRRVKMKGGHPGIGIVSK